MTEYIIARSDDYLAHYGVKGQKHGVRQYQNADGSLTPEGREHYGVGQGNKYINADGSLNKEGQKRYDKANKYVTAKKKTVGQRIRRTLGAGLVGGLIPGVAGAATYGTMAAGLGATGFVGPLAIAGAIHAAPLMAVGALGGLTIAGLKHVTQASKVARGQKFMEQFVSG